MAGFSASDQSHDVFAFGDTANRFVGGNIYFPPSAAAGASHQLLVGIVLAAVIVAAFFLYSKKH